MGCPVNLPVSNGHTSRMWTHLFPFLLPFDPHPRWGRISTVSRPLRQTNLDLKDIDLKDERFRVRGAVPADRLIRSIRKIGLLHPLVVVDRRKNWVLLSGWRRIWACQELGLSSIPVAVLEEPDDGRALLFAVEENLAVRELTYLEKAEIVARLETFGLSELRLRKKILPLLEIPPTRPHLDLFLAMAKFDSEIKDFIASRGVSIAAAQLLAELAPKDRKAVVPLLAPLSRNKQIEMIEDLRDIGRMKRFSVRKILQSEEIRAILGSDAWPAVQKSERIRQIVKRMRYPRLAAWQEEFDSALRRLKWPRDVRIEPSPYFEDDWMSVTFRFRDPPGFKNGVGQLSRLGATEDLDSLWKHGRGK